MNDDDAFLEAILHEPNSQRPRLVYADWLDERRDPRGELIRLQCALETWPSRDRAWKSFDRRERKLLSRLGGPYEGAVLLRNRFQRCERTLRGRQHREYRLSGWLEGTLALGRRLTVGLFVTFNGQRVAAVHGPTPDVPIPFRLPAPVGENVPGRVRVYYWPVLLRLLRSLEFWLDGRRLYAEGF